MKRSAALKPLSRDHHQALVVAQKLRRATARDAAETTRFFLDFWRRHGHAHFRVEEDLLLPAYAQFGDARHEAVVRVLTDHVLIRARASALEARHRPVLEPLHELGGLLEAHVRHEERVLFPLIEEALPPERLATLAAEVERAETVQEGALTD
jgi:hemerythrin-like domain-containing protein